MGPGQFFGGKAFVELLGMGWRTTADRLGVHRVGGLEQLRIHVVDRWLTFV